MTKADRKTADQFLDDLFAEARASQPGPSDALLRAVYEDAATLTANRHERASRGLLGWLRAFTEPVGGYGGLAALAGCAVVGFWVGFSQPVPMSLFPADETLAEDEVSFLVMGEDEDLAAVLLGEG